MAVPRTSAQAEQALSFDGAPALERLAGRAPSSHEPGKAPGRVAGRARLGRRTKQLVARLEAGEVAVIDHPELDRLSAEQLVAAGARGVVNLASSISGRYPNLGPSVLVEAGVALVDTPGARLFDLLADGDEVVIDAGRVRHGGRIVAHGRRLDRASVEQALEAARARVGAALDDFVANTLARLHAERSLLSEPLVLPELRTRLLGRPALVVARGCGAGDDLRALGDFIRGRDPALVAVDGGADVLEAAGLRADLIVGDMDSISDAALASGAELVVHAYADGRAPGAGRLDALGLYHRSITTPGTSEDAALLLAAESGARPVVCVGSGTSLADFLDRNRPGMASTLLTRLRLGEVLVDARGIGQLFEPGRGALT